jgi:hypothetical protein
LRANPFGDHGVQGAQDSKRGLHSTQRILVALEDLAGEAYLEDLVLRVGLFKGRGDDGEVAASQQWHNDDRAQNFSRTMEVVEVVVVQVGGDLAFQTGCPAGMTAT